MSETTDSKNPWSSAYEAPKVSEESLDAGGSYVGTSPESDGTSGAGTLGNTIIE